MSQWIQKAVSKGKGKFSSQAKKAGMSTASYAKAKAKAPGKLGKEARLAETLEKMHRGAGHG